MCVYTRMCVHVCVDLEALVTNPVLKGTWAGGTCPVATNRSSGVVRGLSRDTLPDLPLRHDQGGELSRGLRGNRVDYGAFACAHAAASGPAVSSVGEDKER